MKTSASIEPRLSTASGSGSDEEDVGGPLVVITSKNRQTLTHDHCAADDNGYSTDKEPATDESLGSKPEEIDIAPPPTPILCPESSSGTALESPDRAWDRAVAEAKGQAVARLEEQLRSAQAELRLRDEEVSRLTKIRERIEAELEELTASLFQEAHNMVRDANVRQAAAERSLKESQMQVEVLSAEVSALKTLVLTSTPSRPNPHLHPQIDPSVASVNGGGLFARKHRRSPSHFNLKYGRENSPPDSPVKEPPYGSNATSSAAAAAAAAAAVVDFNDSKDGWEVDPIVHREFVAWRQHPRLDRTEPFIARVYAEEIELCLTFANSTLGEQVRNAIEQGTIAVEAVTDKTRTLFPKKCALLEAPRQCHYRMKVADSDQWHFISKICRNRIISVCEFLNYLRYIERGLVKSSVHDNYWEMTRLRKEMVLARLGLSISSS